MARPPISSMVLWSHDPLFHLVSQPLEYAPRGSMVSGAPVSSAMICRVRRATVTASSVGGRHLVEGAAGLGAPSTCEGLDSHARC